MVRPRGPACRRAAGRCLVLPDPGTGCPWQGAAWWAGWHGGFLVGMYHIAVYFDVPADRREDFIAAALDDGRNSAADEPGTRRFELIVDQDDPNRFYLNEAYDDEKAFAVHADGPHFARFFELISSYAAGPTWLIKGNRVEDPKAAAAPLVLLAEFRAAPGSEARLRQALAGMVEPSLAEPGCLEYRPYVDPTDPARMLIVEQWQDRAALDYHFQTEHFRKVSDVLDQILAEPFTIRHLKAGGA